MNKNKLSGFFKTEYGRMTSYVRSLLADAADRDSEDVVQDVMTRMFETADISRPIEDIAAYIYRALKNSVIDILRKKGIQSLSIHKENNALSVIDQLYDDRNSPEILFEKNETGKALDIAIDALPDELKSVFVMNGIEGKTFREISESSGIPQGTLMARKARAVDILRNILMDYKIYMED
jgi:RNA polymerase sigma factor (sigma-70 family)